MGAPRFRSSKILKPADYCYTLAEVATELGVGRERVRQIEHEALRKLRIAFEAKGLGPTELDEEPDWGVHEIPIHFDR